jgi:hypothetical protein
MYESEEDEDEDFEMGGIIVSKEFDDITGLESQDSKIRRRRILEEIQRREDEEYANEWGYSVVKALRGNSVGRRLRRKLCKYGTIQVICGFALAILTILEGI